MGGEEAASESAGRFMSIEQIIRKTSSDELSYASEEQMKDIKLPCYDITIHLDEETGCGTITSGLKGPDDTAPTNSTPLLMASNR